MTTDFIDLPSPGQKYRNESPISDREKVLLKAAKDIKADLELRAGFEEDNTVAVGSGVWNGLCEALAAYGKEEGK